MGVRFGVPVEVAFDYLAEPGNRPDWQSSLKAVEVLDEGPPCVGQRWYDVTRPGLRPLMELTELDRPRSWTERGTWRSFGAELTLDFEPDKDGCVVTARLRVTGPPVLSSMATGAARFAVRSDLRRAARLLEARAAT
jgi:hypothetical protein